MRISTGCEFYCSGLAILRRAKLVSTQFSSKLVTKWYELSWFSKLEANRRGCGLCYSEPGWPHSSDQKFVLLGLAQSVIESSLFLMMHRGLSSFDLTSLISLSNLKNFPLIPFINLPGNNRRCTYTDLMVVACLRLLLLDRAQEPWLGLQLLCGHRS